MLWSWLWLKWNFLHKCFQLFAVYLQVDKVVLVTGCKLRIIRIYFFNFQLCFFSMFSPAIEHIHRVVTQLLWTTFLMPSGPSLSNILASFQDIFVDLSSSKSVLIDPSLFVPTDFSLYFYLFCVVEEVGVSVVIWPEYS